MEQNSEEQHCVLSVAEEGSDNIVSITQIILACIFVYRLFPTKQKLSFLAPWQNSMQLPNGLFYLQQYFTPTYL